MAWQEEAGAQVVEAADAAETAVTADGSGLIGRLTDGDITTQDWALLWSDLGWPLTKAIILIIAIFILAGWAKRFVTGVCRKAKIDETLAKFFGNMLRWGVLLLGGIAVLKTFGIDTTSFAAVVAAMGFALGMALSGTLGNFAAGVMLLVFRPFKVGDVVSAGGITGKVDEVGMFSTTFDTPDNRRIIVPNGSIYGSTIENISHHETRRVDVAVGTDYTADLDNTREVLTAAAAAVAGRLASEPPVIFLAELGGSSIDWSVRVWCNAADYWAVREQLTRDVKVALDAAGIGIPFPQRDVHIPGGIEVRVTNS